MARIPHVMCANDGREMVIDGTGVLIECTLEDDSPYYKIYADCWYCPGCGSRVYLPADQPVAMHFEDNYGSYHARNLVKLT